jgi:hypothetical protein
LLARLDGAHQLLSNGEELPPFDYHCPLASLPLAFGTRLETIPAPTPYLVADAERVAKWRLRLGDKTRLRVGLAWSGNAAHKNDRNRSVPLSMMSGLVSSNVQFVGLQTELRSTDKSAFGERNDILWFGDELKDFSDTAALVDLMDLVITVDTSVAHLAGARGKPVWILLPLLPDWRWLLRRDDSPWYPTARLFRQNTRGHWESVIDRVGTALAQVI